MSENLKNSFFNKQRNLEKLKSELKSEFFGINHIIDELADHFSSWDLLSDIQEKPMVINLWGLTGVGKTALIYRMVEKLELLNIYYRFDLGEKEGSYSFRSSLEDLSENESDMPVIITLDEMQHSRTLDGPFRKELENDKNRMIWELIDSGKIQYVEWISGLWKLEELKSQLEHLIRAGLKVEKGKVIKEKELFCIELGLKYEEKETYELIEEKHYSTIFEISSKFLEIHLMNDVIEKLQKLDEHESLVFLKKLIAYANRPKTKSFAKSLIFVVGNLDEAYQINSNFSVDIDADVFYEHTREISVPKVKLALRERFRDEQIARLGNIHIVYPSLNKKAYLQIITNQLVSFSKKLEEKFHFKIVFDASITQLIYQEGVYPTQGVRPVFTSVHQLIKSRMSTIISVIYVKDLEVDQLHFSYQHQMLLVQYYFQKELAYEESLKLKLQLSDLRKSRKDDKQAVTAVHESGHIVLSVVLLKLTPLFAFSVSADPENQGFIISKPDETIIVKKDLIARVAVILGGLVAEEYIFGEESLTSGAGKDISTATEFLTEMILRNGMGQTPIAVGLPLANNENEYHHYQSFEEQVKDHIIQAKNLAKETLIKERDFLLTLSEYLSDHSMIEQNHMEYLAKLHQTNYQTKHQNGYLHPFRNMLKQQVNEQFDPHERKPINAPVYLNKTN